MTGLTGHIRKWQGAVQLEQAIAAARKLDPARQDEIAAVLQMLIRDNEPSAIERPETDCGKVHALRIEARRAGTRFRGARFTRA
jgi:hypothetical protein